VKPKIIIVGALAAVMSAAGLAGCASERQAQAQFLAQARIGREQAARVALAQAPGGRIKEGELENDDGKLVWWFDLVTPGSNGVTEVSVDASTGGVISVATEMPERPEKN
jgi:uncharacterized membrane protein YkoI